MGYLDSFAEKRVIGWKPSKVINNLPPRSSYREMGILNRVTIAGIAVIQ